MCVCPGGLRKQILKGFLFGSLDETGSIDSRISVRFGPGRSQYVEKDKGDLTVWSLGPGEGQKGPQLPKNGFPQSCKFASFFFFAPPPWGNIQGGAVGEHVRRQIFSLQ